MALPRIALGGLPHSEIPGSKPVCGSPGLIAAYHVLHRRPAPRHPPCALSSLTTTFTLLETRSRTTLRLHSSFASNLRLSMSPGFPPAAAWTPPAGFRFGKPAAGVLGKIISWWSWPGSNRRPPPCKGGALPVELQPLINWGPLTQPSACGGPLTSHQWRPLTQP